MERIRLGVIGLGRVASKTHLPVLRSLPGVEVTAGAESNPERAARVAGMFGLRVYGSYREMCSSGSLDAVYVCLPNFLHREACLAAIESGLHVLCEKPMGMSAAEAREMVESAEGKGLVLMPGYKKRYAANFARAREIIDRGLLGRIIHVQGTFVTPGPYISWDPKSDWYLDEKWHGVVYDTGCHLVDLLLYLVPGRVMEMRALAAREFRGFATPTNVSAAFRLEGEIMGDVAIGWRGGADSLEVTVHGTAGSLTVSRDHLLWTHPGTDPVDKIGSLLGNAGRQGLALARKVGDKLAGRNFYAEDRLQAEAFCRAVRGEAPPPVTAREAVAVHEFLAAMIGSLDGAGGGPGERG